MKYELYDWDSAPHDYINWGKELTVHNLSHGTSYKSIGFDRASLILVTEGDENDKPILPFGFDALVFQDAEAVKYDDFLLGVKWIVALGS